MSKLDSGNLDCQAHPMTGLGTLVGCIGSKSSLERRCSTFSYLMRLPREATKQLDDDLRTQHDEIPWKEMVGIRDVIVHGYFAVNLEVVWTTVHEDFPSTKSHLRKMRMTLESTER